MGALVIKSNSKENLRLIVKLAKMLGESVTPLTDEQIEDLALGKLMKKVKTGKNVSRETVMRQLRSK